MNTNNDYNIIIDNDNEEHSGLSEKIDNYYKRNNSRLNKVNEVDKQKEVNLNFKET